MITVMKFGGTSVGSSEAIQRVANIIVNTEGDKAVVASAMSGITNYLVSVVDSKRTDFDVVTNEFAEKHLKAASEMFDEATMKEFREEFDRRLRNFKSALNENSSDPYYKDLITSQGERFSTLMLSFYLRMMGYESVALTAETAGIAAIGFPLSGSADLEYTEKGMTEKVMPYIKKGVIPVITGFYGIKDGAPLTFGRGGSDYSAAVVANALNADMLEIWTDVDGFMTSDPRMVKNALKIDEMSYVEASELAHFGAKVLHPRTIEPVRLKGIPLKVRNSFNPSEPGTLIKNVKSTKSINLIGGIATKKDMTLISIRSAEISYDPSRFADIVNAISDGNILIYGISLSLSTVALLVETNDSEKAQKILKRMIGDDIENTYNINNLALICCVGDDMRRTCGITAEILSVAKDIGAEVEMISEGASEVSMNFVIPMDKMEDVVKALHKRYIR